MDLAKWKKIVIDAQAWEDMMIKLGWKRPLESFKDLKGKVKMIEAELVHKQADWIWPKIANMFYLQLAGSSQET